MADYRPKRLATRFPVALKGDGWEQRVIMRNISIDGARVEVAEPILAGSAVRVTIGSATFPALIQWSRKGSVGLRFMKRPDPQLIDLIPEDER